MSKRDDRAFVEDMLERIALVAEFTSANRDAFMQSRMMQEAVIRALEIIGEASRNLSETLRIPKFPGGKSQHSGTSLSTLTGTSRWSASGRLLKPIFLR